MPPVGIEGIAWKIGAAVLRASDGPGPAPTPVGPEGPDDLNTFKPAPPRPRTNDGFEDVVVGLLVVKTVVGRWLVVVTPVGVDPRPVVVEPPVDGVVVTPIGDVDSFPVEIVTPVGFDGWCSTQQSPHRRQ